MHRNSITLSRRLFTALALLLAFAPLSALAETRTTTAFELTLPAGSLEQALLQLARQTGVNLSYDLAQLQPFQVSGLQGQHDIETALRLLLQNTTLAFQAETGGYRIFSGNTPQTNTLLLAPLTIRGQTDPADLPYQTPGSVNVLTQRDIERFRGTSVGDIFQGTAGVLIGENRNSGGLDVNIRGMQGQGRVPVLVDGARQETTVYRGYSGVASRSYIDPDLIGGIRIDKGPVMTAEGTGATGGVVSVRTIGANDIIKDGKDWGIRLRGSLIGNNTGDPVEPGTVGGFMLGAAFGDDLIYRTRCARPDICQQMHPNGLRTYELPDTFAPNEGMTRPGLLEPKSYAGSLALAKRFDWGDLVAAYTQRSQGNYYTGKHGNTPYLVLEEIDRTQLYTEVKPTLRGNYSRFRAEELIINSNFYSESLLLKANLMPADDHAWELGYMRYDSEYSELMPSQLMWFGQIRQTDNSTVQVHTYTSRYHWDSSEYDWLDLRFNLWHTHTNSHNKNYSADMEEDFSFIVPEQEAEIYNRWGADLSNTQRLYTWGTTELSYGIAAQTERAQPEKMPEYDWQSASDYIRNARREELSAFASVRYQPINSLTLDAGIRYTRFDSKDLNPRLITDTSSPLCIQDANGSCEPISSVYNGSGTAPVITLTWEPVKGLQFYGRYAEALRMPSLFEGSRGFSQAPTLEINLRPEHAKNRELGLNFLSTNIFQDNDKLGLKFSAFQNNTENYLTRTSANTWEQNFHGTFLRNIEGVRFHGVELSLNYDMGWLYTSLSATKYNKIEICHVGSYRRSICNNYGIADSYINNMVPPNWHGSAILGTRLFSEKLELGIRGTFMGERNNPEYDNDTHRGTVFVIEWHDYRVLDLYASYTPNDIFSIDLNIDNFTDRYYIDALSLGLVPSPGRTAKLSFTLHF